MKIMFLLSRLAQRRSNDPHTDTKPHDTQTHRHMDTQTHGHRDIHALGHFDTQTNSQKIICTHMRTHVQNTPEDMYAGVVYTQKKASDKNSRLELVWASRAGRASYRNTRSQLVHDEALVATSLCMCLVVTSLCVVKTLVSNLSGTAMSAEALYRCEHKGSTRTHLGYFGWNNLNPCFACTRNWKDISHQINVMPILLLDFRVKGCAHELRSQSAGT